MRIFFFLIGDRIGGLLELANPSNYMFFSLGMWIGVLVEMLATQLSNCSHSLIPHITRHYTIEYRLRSLLICLIRPAQHG